MCVPIVDANIGQQKQEIDIDMRFIKGSDVRVLSGLSAGDRLIIEGHRFCVTESSRAALLQQTVGSSGR